MLFNLAGMATKQTSPIEQYIIDRIRKIRMDQGVSQAELANRIDVSNAFIGRVESMKFREKYNFNHVNNIAKALNVRIWEIVPEMPM